jgi:hypothetical protein
MDPESETTEPTGSLSEASGRAVPGAADPDAIERSRAQWDERDERVISLAYDAALEELRDASKPFEQVKSRAAVLFGSITAAMAFLIGSALQSLDRSTINYSWVAVGTASYCIFGLLVLVLLFPWKRPSAFDAQAIRNLYVLGNQPDDSFRPEHAYDVIQVKWSLIAIAHNLVESGAGKLRWIRWVFVGALLAATSAIAFWALVVAYASPLPPH